MASRQNPVIAVTVGKRTELYSFDDQRLHRLMNMSASSVRFSPSGNFLVVVEDDGKVTRFDTSGQHPLALLKLPGPQAGPLSCNADCTTIVLGTNNGSGFAWRAGHRTELPDGLSKSTIDPTGTLLAWINPRREIRTMDLDRGTIGPILKRLDLPVVGLSFMNGRSQLAVAMGGTADVLTLEGGAPPFEVNLRSSLLGLDVSPTGQLLLSGGSVAGLYDGRGANVGFPLEAETSIAASFDDSGRFIVGLDNSARWGAVHIWNASDGFPVGQPKYVVGPLRGAELAPDGSVVATSVEDNGTVIRWTLAGDTDFPSASRELQVEALTGTTMDDNGNIHLLSADALARTQVQYKGVAQLHARSCSSARRDPCAICSE